MKRSLLSVGAGWAVAALLLRPMGLIAEPNQSVEDFWIWPLVAGFGTAPLALVLWGAIVHPFYTLSPRDSLFWRPLVCIPIAALGFGAVCALLVYSAAFLLLGNSQFWVCSIDGAIFGAVTSAVARTCKRRELQPTPMLRRRRTAQATAVVWLLFAAIFNPWTPYGCWLLGISKVCIRNESDAPLTDVVVRGVTGTVQTGRGQGFNYSIPNIAPGKSFYVRLRTPMLFIDEVTATHHTKPKRLDGGMIGGVEPGWSKGIAVQSDGSVVHFPALPRDWCPVGRGGERTTDE